MSNDFPNSPILGQQFEALNNIVYEWDGEKWVVVTEETDFTLFDDRYLRKTGDTATGILGVQRTAPAFRLSRTTLLPATLGRFFDVQINVSGGFSLVLRNEDLDIKAEFVDASQDADGIDGITFRLNEAASGGDAVVTVGTLERYDPGAPVIQSETQLLNQQLADTRYLQSADLAAATGQALYFYYTTPSGVSGVALAAGNNAIPLNTVGVNTIVGANADTGTGTVSLEAGTYEIEAAAAGVTAGAIGVQARVVNLNDGSAIVARGLTRRLGPEGNESGYSICQGKATFAATADLRLEIFCTGGCSSGIPVNSGDNETYAYLIVRRIS